MIKEACVETMEECLHAIHNSADQLEICSDLEHDGLTPDIKLIKDVISISQIPIKVMIRCRSGNFFYSNLEISEMIHTVKKFKKLSIQGFVFGALQEDANGRVVIDLEAVKNICDAAYPFPVTFHKAIDLCSDILKEAKKLKTVKNIKFILSSGCKSTALEGVDILKNLQIIAYPEIQIIAAGKINGKNIETLEKLTKLNYFHGKHIV